MENIPIPCSHELSCPVSGQIIGLSSLHSSIATITYTYVGMYNPTHVLQLCTCRYVPLLFTVHLDILPSYYSDSCYNIDEVFKLKIVSHSSKLIILLRSWIIT